MSLLEKNINITTKKSFLDFTQGSDPEFTIVKSDLKTVVAAKGELNADDELGHDGNGVTFEARPEPSTNPIEHVNNIRGIFARQVLKNPKFLDYHWLAGSHNYGFPMGGHIHFGIKEKQFSPRVAANTLSQYVGLITLLLEDKKEGLLRRKNSGYGEMEDYRVQSYGFEYRTPSSWLVCPYITTAILCLAKVVMFECLNNDKFKPSTRVTPDIFSNDKEQELYKIFPEIWEEIKEMILYQQYKMQIDPIYFLISKKLSWFPQKRVNKKLEPVPLKEAWGIIDSKTAFATKVKLDAIWSRFNSSQRNCERQIGSMVEVTRM
jgi:hypothetical protein